MASNSTSEYKVIADKIVSPDEDIIVHVAGDMYKGSITEQNRYTTVADIAEVGGGNTGLIKAGHWNYPSQNGVAVQPFFDGESIAIKSSYSAAVRWHVRNGGASLAGSGTIEALSIIQQNGENGVGPYQVVFEIEEQTSLPAIDHYYTVQYQGPWAGSYLALASTLTTITLEYPGPDLPGANNEFTGATLIPPSVYNQVEAREDGVWIKNANWTDPQDYTYYWNFKTNGTIQFPSNNSNSRTGSGEVLQFGNVYQQSIITGPDTTAQEPTAQRLVIAGQDGFTGTSGEGGDLYLWAGRGGSAGGSGGDIKLDAGNGSTAGEGGTVKMRAGSSIDGNGGFVQIYAGSSNNGNGGPITIEAGSNYVDTESYGGTIYINGGHSGNALGGGGISLTTTQGGNISLTAQGGGKISLAGFNGAYIGDPNVAHNAIATVLALPYIKVTPPVTSLGEEGNVAGQGSIDNDYIYYCTGTYDGTTNIWKRIAWSNDTWGA